MSSLTPVAAQVPLEMSAAATHWQQLHDADAELGRQAEEAKRDRHTGRAAQIRHKRQRHTVLEHHDNTAGILCTATSRHVRISAPVVPTQPSVLHHEWRTRMQPSSLVAGGPVTPWRPRCQYRHQAKQQSCWSRRQCCRLSRQLAATLRLHDGWCRLVCRAPRWHRRQRACGPPCGCSVWLPPHSWCWHQRRPGGTAG